MQQCAPTPTTLSHKKLAIAILVVACGGAVGTALRDLLLKLQPTTSGGELDLENPVDFARHQCGGVYLATKLLRGALRHHDPNNLMRLLLITGLFGGFHVLFEPFRRPRRNLAPLHSGSLLVAAGPPERGDCGVGRTSSAARQNDPLLLVVVAGAAGCVVRFLKRIPRAAPHPTLRPMGHGAANAVGWDSPGSTAYATHWTRRTRT